MARVTHGQEGPILEGTRYARVAALLIIEVHNFKLTANGDFALWQLDLACFSRRFYR